MPIYMNKGGSSGGGGGYSETLLWTNPSPRSNFAAQTLDIELGDYEWYKIEGVTTTSTMYPFVCMIPYDSDLPGFASGIEVSGWYCRQLGNDNNKLRFSNCYKGSNDTSYNDIIIPQKVYGVNIS
jgi:hypothetical protein